MLESRHCLATHSGSNAVMARDLMLVPISPEGTSIMDALMLEDPTGAGLITLEKSEFSGFFNPETIRYLLVGDAEIPTCRSASPV